MVLNIFYFHPYLGKDEPILTIIFFKWVGSTNQPVQVGKKLGAAVFCLVSQAGKLLLSIAELFEVGRKKYLKEHPSGCKWLATTIVGLSLRIGSWDPLENGRTPWLITGMILQGIQRWECRSWSFGPHGGWNLSRSSFRICWNYHPPPSSSSHHKDSSIFGLRNCNLNRQFANSILGGTG